MTLAKLRCRTAHWMATTIGGSSEAIDLSEMPPQPERVA
jgi:hypothetical protein